MKTLRELERELKITIQDESLFLLALTHPSYNADANTKHQDYERLEFMGDAVLDFVSADIIFKHHPELDQGYMSKLRSYLVKSHSLANYARQMSLVDYIRVGRSIPLKQIESSDKILEDVFEALIGAIYLDQGIKTAYRHIERFLLDDIVNTKIDDLTDYKTRLQEEMQAEHRDSVHYELINQVGPAHDRTFTVNVMFNDIILATGSGKSKKTAEEEAAKNALAKRSV